MADVLIVAGKRFVRNELHRQRFIDPKCGMDAAGELEERDRLDSAGVEDFTPRLRAPERADDPVDRVADVRERACLPAVAVDLDRLPVEQGLGERDDGAAPPREVVERSI